MISLHICITHRPPPINRVILKTPKALDNTMISDFIYGETMHYVCVYAFEAVRSSETTTVLIACCFFAVRFSCCCFFLLLSLRFTGGSTEKSISSRF